MAGIKGRFLDSTSFAVETAAGNGSTTLFTLTNTPLAIAILRVTINGLEQIPTVDYSLSGKNITFATAPETDSNIVFQYIRNEL